jgi:hypothetical protein
MPSKTDSEWHEEIAKDDRPLPEQMADSLSKLNQWVRTTPLYKKWMHDMKNNKCFCEKNEKGTVINICQLCWLEEKEENAKQNQETS